MRPPPNKLEERMRVMEVLFCFRERKERKPQATSSEEESPGLRNRECSGQCRKDRPLVQTAPFAGKASYCKPQRGWYQRGEDTHSNGRKEQMLPEKRTGNQGLAKKR